MLTVNEEHFIARGYHRECYQHPGDNALCIKVVVNGDNAESEREISYYSRLKKRNIDWQMLPRFHGWVETNKGPGAVFDLIRDSDDSVSSTLKHYLESPQLTERFRDQIVSALVDLHNYLIRHKVITMTLKPKNIVLSRVDDNRSKLVVVDNIGNSDWIPLTEYVDYLALRKIRRKWQRFMQLLHNSFPYNHKVKEVLAELPSELIY